MCMKYKAPVWDIFEKPWQSYCIVWNCVNLPTVGEIYLLDLHGKLMPRYTDSIKNSQILVDKEQRSEMRLVKIHIWFGDQQCDSLVVLVWDMIWIYKKDIFSTFWDIWFKFHTPPRTEGLWNVSWKALTAVHYKEGPCSAQRAIQKG